MADNKQEAIAKLKELTEEIDFCMLTTVDGGHLRSRPMSTQQSELDGTLWFFTSDQTHKVDEIEKDNRVNVAYSHPGKDRYVSVSGRATISRDRAKMEELWSDVLKAWFPEGLDQPDLALLKVDIEQAEYWDTPGGKVVQVFGFVKALATGEEFHPGENEKITL
jgi:general stress protein 26